MAFGKKESYTDDTISYIESVDMLLSDMKAWGYKTLTKEQINEILQNDFSIGFAVRKELNRIFDIKKIRLIE